MISLLVIGIIVLVGLATFFLSNGFGVALYAGLAASALGLSQSPLLTPIKQRFGTVEMQEYAIIGVFLLCSFGVAYLMREYMTSRRYRGIVGRVILAAISGVIIGGLAVVLLRNVLGVTETLDIARQFVGIFDGDYAVGGWLIAGLVVAYMGAR